MEKTDKQRISILDTTPEWKRVWKPSLAEEMLPGFKFEGPGWYITEKETILVTPIALQGGNLWDWKPNQIRRQFLFMAWSSPHFMTEVFDAIAKAPVRQDVLKIERVRQ